MTFCMARGDRRRRRRRPARRDSSVDVADPTIGTSAPTHRSDRLDSGRGARSRSPRVGRGVPAPVSGRRRHGRHRGRRRPGRAPGRGRLPAAAPAPSVRARRRRPRGGRPPRCRRGRRGGRSRRDRTLVRVVGSAGGPESAGERADGDDGVGWGEVAVGGHQRPLAARRPRPMSSWWCLASCSPYRARRVDGEDLARTIAGRGECLGVETGQGLGVASGGVGDLVGHRRPGPRRCSRRPTTAARGPTAEHDAGLGHHRPGPFLEEHEHVAHVAGVLERRPRVGVGAGAQQRRPVLAGQVAGERAANLRPSAPISPATSSTAVASNWHSGHGVAGMDRTTTGAGPCRAARPERVRLNGERKLAPCSVLLAVPA